MQLHFILQTYEKKVQKSILHRCVYFRQNTERKHQNHTEIGRFGRFDLKLNPLVFGIDAQ